MKKITFLILFICTISWGQTELIVNGTFETGDLSGWEVTNAQQQTASTDNPYAGTYSMNINNSTPGAASAIKAANLGEGVVQTGDDITISFWARGTTAAGGVLFAEFFTEIENDGGVSGGGILGGAPVALDPNPETWKFFQFTYTDDTNASGGVTMQFNGVTGGDAGSVSNVFIDNVSITIAEAAPPTCDDGIQNGDEEGVDCGGSCPNECDSVTDPTTSAPAVETNGTELYVYGETSGMSVSNFNLNAFNNVGVSEVDIENDGNLTGKIDGPAAPGFFFYGAQWDAVDLVAGGYEFLHISYYVTTSTEFNFFLIDETAGIPGGNPAEPRFRFGGGTPDESLVAGSWQSVFIPLSHFTDFDSGTFPYDLNDIFQYKFDGNGVVYFDNIFFSTSDVLSNDEFTISDFSVSPNPTRGMWNLSGNTIIDQIQVFDLLGKRVFESKPNQMNVEIDATKLKSGLYLARISSQNGTKTIKLVKN